MGANPGIWPLRAAAIFMALLLFGCSGGGGGDGGGGGGGGGSPPPPPPPPPVVGNGRFIVLDQFGYLPDGEKIAFIRDPATGFDASDAFSPGPTYQVVVAGGSTAVLTGAAAAWNNGAVDASSGDRAWRFDFSTVTTPGSYEILDVQRNVRSARFDIGDAVYRPILRQAMRMFFYQRAGFAKASQYAGASWADGASHVGPLQDTQARLFSTPNDASSERDLHGGWYDAGDYNKYTAWAGQDVLTLLHAYFEAPGPFTDDYGIPESGNGAPDILDEIRWELDWLRRMQNADGSVLSIVGLASASPPSSATGQSLYGPASTHATLNAAAAYAFGAKVYGAAGSSAYAADLRSRAINAWNWASANPNVLFRNNDPASGSQGLGAGQQETDDYGRAMDRIIAAVYLFDLTGEAVYRNHVDAHYTEAHLFTFPWASPFEHAIQRPLLYYASLPGASDPVAANIRTQFVVQFDRNDGCGAVIGQRDPYMAHIADYTWGSNSVKALEGQMFMDLVRYDLSSHSANASTQAASHYIHYVHGANPLGKVYLSNMSAFGAEHSVDQFFHAWFADGTRWDSHANSPDGPPPGYLVGGANLHYNWASGCPQISLQCGSAPPSPPFGQPSQKSYLDFNTGWPLNSWEITEPSLSYQTNYVLLLSKFVR